MHRMAYVIVMVNDDLVSSSCQSINNNFCSRNHELSVTRIILRNIHIAAGAVINSLVIGRSGSDYKNEIFHLVLLIGIFRPS